MRVRNTARIRRMPGRSLLRRAALAALLLAAPSLTAPSLAAGMTPHESALYEAAKQEGELNWYVATISTQVAEAMADDFSKRYPGIKVNTSRATGQVIYQRLSSDMRAGTPICDVFSSTDSGQFWGLKKRGLLLKYTPENTAKLPDAFQNFDPDGYFHTSLVGVTMMAYNTDKVTAEEAPKNWTDLTDPKWKNKVALAHPGYSGTVGVWGVLMRKLYGEDFFAKLEKNSPQIGRSLIDPSTMMSSGERIVGIVSLNSASDAIRRGNPMALIYPSDGAMLQILPTAIPKDSKHPNAAKLYFEYLLSVEGSEVLTKFAYAPLRPEVAMPPGMRPFKEVKLIRPTEEEITKGVPEIKETWRDVFGN